MKEYIFYTGSVLAAVGPKLWRIDKNAALEQGALNRKNKKPAGAANTGEPTGDRV